MRPGFEADPLLPRINEQLMHQSNPQLAIATEDARSHLDDVWISAWVLLGVCALAFV